MDDSIWKAVDQYLGKTILTEDRDLKSAVQDSERAGLPPIQVTPAHGKLLNILAQTCRAQRILEVGTLGGYSTVWLARALPKNGHLITVELEPKHAAVARTNLERARLSNRVEIRVGPALKLLPALAKEKPAPFDLSFIDANKDACREYFDWAVKLSRPGALIIVDNVVRQGAVADASTKDALVRGVRRLHQAVAKDKRVSATTIQTVGQKGYDGFLIAVVN